MLRSLAVVFCLVFLAACSSSPKPHPSASAGPVLSGGDCLPGHWRLLSETSTLATPTTYRTLSGLANTTLIVARPASFTYYYANSSPLVGTDNLSPYSARLRGTLVEQISPILGPAASQDTFFTLVSNQATQSLTLGSKAQPSAPLPDPPDLRAIYTCRNNSLSITARTTDPAYVLVVTDTFVRIA